MLGRPRKGEVNRRKGSIAVSWKETEMGGFAGCLPCQPQLSPQEPTREKCEKGEPGREKCGPRKGWAVDVASSPGSLSLPTSQIVKATKHIWPGVSQSLAKN